MPKIIKKEIRRTVEQAMANALLKLKISLPSKKAKKGFAKVSKEIASILKHELKRIKKSRVTKKKGAKVPKKIAPQKKVKKGK